MEKIILSKRATLKMTRNAQLEEIKQKIKAFIVKNECLSSLMK